MDEEEAVKNVIRKKEKKFKAKSKKGEKNESSMGKQEGPKTNGVEAIEHDRLSGKHEIAERKRDRTKDKAKKNEGKEVAEDGSGNAIDTVERMKKRKEKNKTSNAIEVEGNENEKTLDKESISEVNSTKDGNKERKMRKVKRKREDVDFEMEGEKEVDQHTQNGDGDTEMIERKKRKKEKKKNKHDEVDSSLLPPENVQVNVEGNTESTNPDENATKELERKKKKKNNNNNKMKDNVDNDNCGLTQTDEKGSDDVGHEKMKKKKKNHSQKLESGPDDLPEKEVSSEKKGKEKKTKSVDFGSNDATPNKKKKKVRFSDQDEVFPITGNSNMEEVKDGKENIVRGKRFTPEEDEILKDAVLAYIERHDLGEEGLNMVLNCKKHKEVKGCWTEIADAIPYRPREAIYYRAQILFRRSDDRKWTQEEKDEVMKHQQEHGNEWKALADMLGKHRFHVKDTWRRLKLSDRKKGKWTQEEYQNLFNLVNVDLQAKLSEEKKSKHGMLRDNVCWTAISDELSTRHQADCCMKWYNQLTSRMVVDGEWADTDDYRLIGALYSLDANCMEDVDWDSIVEDRTGDVCRKRWNEMVLHIGKNRDKSFAEQVEVMAQRYCPNLLEARETWDSKPRVP